MRFGIDFGTTQTVVALCDRGNYPVIHFEGPDGETLDGYPTAVASKGDERRYGPAAVACVGVPGWTVLRSFKRLLADPGISPQTPVALGEHEVPLLTLITDFLTALAADLRTRSTLPAHLSDEVMEAVIAVPANSHSAQRFITLEAFRQAGFEVSAMLNEPSAGALEYADRYARSFSSRRQNVLVYDLGGGTFDASLVDMSANAHVVKASLGLAQAGGDDFDETLAALALEQLNQTRALDGLAAISRDTLSDAAWMALMHHCRDLKESLGNNTRRVLVELGATLPQDELENLGIDVEDTINVKTSDYYARCRPLIERTLDVIARIQGLAPGELDPSIAGLYVVGGASSLPVVGRVLREVFGRRVRRAPYPSAATAVGLAIAAEHPEITVTERLSRHFGVFREWRHGAEVSFDIIFDHQTALPSHAEGHTSIVRRYRPHHNVGHFRYIECSHTDKEGAPDGDITPFGEVLFAFDPALRSAEASLERIAVTRGDAPGPLIEERYTLASTGIVEFTITDLEQNYQRSFRIGEAQA